MAKPPPRDTTYSEHNRRRLRRPSKGLEPLTKITTNTHEDIPRAVRAPRDETHEKPTVAIPPLQVVSEGRVVMYHFRGRSGTIESRPMMVTTIDDREYVNGEVFYEPGDGVTDRCVRRVRIHDEGPYQPHTWSFRERHP